MHCGRVYKTILAKSDFFVIYGDPEDVIYAFTCLAFETFFVMELQMQKRGFWRWERFIVS
jgi:hypothetical protein